MITFTETTGLLDADDIRDKTRVWRFNEASGDITVLEHGKARRIVERSVMRKIDGPITIRSFVENYLDNPGSARVATLNGVDKFVLQKNGDWDRPLRDGDEIGLAVVAGFWNVFFMVIMAIMMAYSIYMILTMKTGDGTGATTQYSLSGTQNNKRYGKPIEKQYGLLKRYPAYAANPYTIYDGNKQILYAIYCLGHGEYSDLELGFADTNADGFYNVTTTIINPYESAALFDNNVRTCAEVSGGIELIPYNEGINAGEDGAWEDSGYVGPGGYTNFSTPYGSEDGWTEWFNVNPVGTSAKSILIDLEFPNGLGHTQKDGDSQSYTVTCEIQKRSVTVGSGGSLVYGTPVTHTYSFTKSTSSALRYTKEIDTFDGAWQCRARRTTMRNALHSANGQRTRETLRWTALRGKLPNVNNFGNTTCVMLRAEAQSGLTDAAAKRFYIKGTAKTPVYDSGTSTWSTIATRNPVWAACDIMRSSYGGRYDDSMLDLSQLSEWAEWCDDNDVTFDYCFDDEMDVIKAISMCFRVFRAAPAFPLQKLRVVRDEPQSPVDIFTKENIVNDSFQVQYRLPTEDDFDGYLIEYTDEDSWETETVEAVLPGYDGAKLKTVKLPGVINRTKAYRLGMYELAVELGNRQQVTFDTNLNGKLRMPGDVVYVNAPMFRQSDSGMILDITGSTITLDRNVNLEAGNTYNLIIRSQLDGSILGSYEVDYAEEGVYSILTADSPPNTTGMYFDDPQSCPIFSIGIGYNFGKLCRITSIKHVEGGASIEAFVDTNTRFAFDLAFPDTGIPNQEPTVTPSAPTNVVAAPYDPDDDGIPTDISISWTPVSGFTNYTVQYSSDGINWTVLSNSTTSTTLYLGEYITGNFYARVAVVSGGYVWAWGESALVYMPSNLTQYVHVSSDGFVDVSSDGYISVHYGA